MYVTEEILNGIIKCFGKPEQAHLEFQVTDTEYQRIKSSQKHGRKHDITLYILKDDSIIVIAKPFYPPGMYRAPSGGLRPGEPFVDGARREAFEETGCKIELTKFLLRTDVRFVSESGVIDWSSYVMQAKYVSGDFQFTDHHEIKEVRLAKLSEFETFSRIMRSTNIGGLHYRAALHDVVKPLLSGITK